MIRLVIAALLCVGAIAAIGPDALYGPAATVVTFMDAGPGFPQVLLYMALAAIPVTLLHEFGHALAARRLLGTPVSIAVGSVGPLAQLELGQISVSLNALGSAARVAGSVFAVLNLIPFTIQERRDGPSLQTDGRLALDAARVLGSLR